MKITVIGMPGPQGSKRYVGKGIMIESSALVKPWRIAVTHEAVAEKQRLGAATITGPVCMRVVFTFRRPKSAPRSRKYPDRTPDIDKTIRAVCDSLTDAGIWEDDARVVHCTASKVFAGSPGALDVPGCVIEIEAMA